ncbi:MAG TPA: O-antigen ligase family protein [Solirubrobacteraceae bacterium]|nr:O-antigen ligase family protein [Solirubrobacteraceae bacterium]
MTSTSAGPAAAVARLSFARRLAPVLAVLPGLVAAGMFVLWGVHDGGYDNDTWYWGALLTLAMLAGTVLARRGAIRVARPARLALAAFTLYVAWSYLSISWAPAKGVALEGSNRALLYLMLYALMLVLPWRGRLVQAALGVWILGIGILAVALLFRFAEQDDISVLLVGGRLAAPTGYINGTSALFFMAALTSVAVAVPRGLPGPARGLALAFACAELSLVLIVQSRGWLFTLPIVALLVAALLTDRLRAIPFMALPVAGVAVILPRLLAVYDASAAQVSATVGRAGQSGLLVCFTVFVVGTLLAWGDWLLRERTLSRNARRALGTLVAVGIVAGAGGGAVAATHGHPVRFIARQWNGFTRQEQSASPGTSHFVNVGSGRYDFWRVALDAFASHPVGGLGQDNFDDYYIARGRSGEEPKWTHSLEMRLLAHTGAVGLVLFAAFLVAAIAAAVRARRSRDGLVRALAAAGLMPLIVWTVHGSVDWFWEMPALSGPALGFLGAAGALARPAAARTADASSRSRDRRRHTALPAVGWLLSAVIALAATVALGLPYLATRKASIASNLAASNPRAALAELHSAADLDPLSSEVTRSAGQIALQIGDLRLAAHWFNETLRREPGDWYAYLGAGLAASALGDRATARRDFAAAVRHDRFQPASQVALKRVDTSHPLTPAQGLNLLQAGN